MAQKKDKILPIKVWLDEESCWNNEPKYSEGYVGYVREDYHAQAMLHVLQKGKEFGKEEMLDRVCKWLEEHSWDYLVGADNVYILLDDKMVSDLKKAMEG